MSIPKTKLWNRADWSVWSLATTDKGGTPNMNICTYVVPVSMKPKAFLVALYDNTKTLDNVQKTKRGTLQLLSQEQGHLVRRFGKQSGCKVDKFKTLKDTYSMINNIPVLDECLGYAELEFKELYRGGDHLLGYAEVVNHKNLSEGKIMTTHWLKEKKYIV